MNSTNPGAQCHSKPSEGCLLTCKEQSDSLPDYFAQNDQQEETEVVSLTDGFKYFLLTKKAKQAENILHRNVDM